MALRGALGPSHGSYPPVKGMVYKKQRPSCWQASPCIMGTVNDSSSAFRRADNKEIPALGARQTDVPSLNVLKCAEERRTKHVVSSSKRTAEVKVCQWIGAAASQSQGEVSAFHKRWKREADRPRSQNR